MLRLLYLTILCISMVSAKELHGICSEMVVQEDIYHFNGTYCLMFESVFGGGPGCEYAPYNISGTKYDIVNTGHSMTDYICDHNITGKGFLNDYCTDPSYRRITIAKVFTDPNKNGYNLTQYYTNYYEFDKEIDLKGPYECIMKINVEEVKVMDDETFRNIMGFSLSFGFALLAGLVLIGWRIGKRRGNSLKGESV